MQLGRKRSAADPRAIGLVDRDHPLNLRRGNACALAGARCGRRRRGDIGIGSVVDIEQGALRALDHDLLAGIECVLDKCFSWLDVGREALAELAVLLNYSVWLERVSPIDASQQVVLMDDLDLEPFAQ
jgi:hypothetical protein